MTRSMYGSITHAWTPDYAFFYIALREYGHIGPLGEDPAVAQGQRRGRHAQCTGGLRMLGPLITRFSIYCITGVFGIEARWEKTLQWRKDNDVDDTLNVRGDYACLDP
jgi:hypothetical protein